MNRSLARLSMGASLLTVVFAVSAIADTIENEFWRLEFDSGSGAIVSLSASNGTMDAEMTGIVRQAKKTATGGVAICELTTGNTYRPGSDDCHLMKLVAEGRSAKMEHRIEAGSEELTLKTTWTLDNGELSWKATLTGSGSGNRSYRVIQELPVPDGWSMWVQTTPERIRFSRQTRPFEFWYVRAPEGYDRFDNQYPRNDLTIPQVTLLAAGSDLGVTVAHHVDDRKPSSGFIGRMRPDSSWVLQAITALVGLRDGKPLEVSGYLIAHPRCYRPGLQWVFNKWPEYFLPDPAVYAKSGIFATGIPSIGDKGPDGAFNFAGYPQFNARFMEIHMHFPFYGLYYPDEGDPEVWSDVWGVERQNPQDSTLSLEKINRCMKNLADNGFHTFYYFGVNDCYPPLAAERWPEAVTKWHDGREGLSGWRGGGIEYRNVNPDTAWGFGRDMVRQLNGILQDVRPLSGLFFDTVHHNDLDFAHDDGVTLVYLNGKSVPAYSINFGYDFYMRYLSRRMRPRGMHLFTNGPVAIRNGIGVDAVMLESFWDYEFQNRRFLSCLSRPLYWLSPGRHDVRREIILQRCLIYGAFTHNPPSAYPENMLRVRQEDKHLEFDRKQFDAYVPLHELLRGRTLCFEPDPVSVPDGYRAEVFTLPDGRYAVSVINEQMSVFDPYSSSRLKIRLRLKNEISSANIFTPLNHEGEGLEGATNANGELEFEIKDFRGAAVLMLSPAY